MRLLRFTLVGVAALAGAAALAAQSASPAVRIAAPTEDTYLVGPSRLVAMIDPPSAVKEIVTVTFFADGKQVCVVTRPPFECGWDAGDRMSEHQIRVSALKRDGSRLTQTVRTRNVEVTESVDVDVVQVTAVVLDDGRFVRNLKREDFKVWADERSQPITHFASENIPLELVAALDVSSSMEPSIDSVKDASKRFLSAIEERDQVTVLAFNENIFIPARRATDQAKRLSAIDRIRPWGGTALYDAIVRSVEILGRQPGRRAIVLFSDGEDQSSHAGLEDAIRATEGSDAIIYAIGQGRALAQPTLQKLMQRLASASGGRAFFYEDPTRLDAMFAEILDDLRNQYVFSFPAPEGHRDGALHSIRVEVAGGKYHVRARQGYRLIR
jgi:VWFA-related protein